MNPFNLRNFDLGRGHEWDRKYAHWLNGSVSLGSGDKSMFRFQSLGSSERQ